MNLRLRIQFSKRCRVCPCSHTNIPAGCCVFALHFRVTAGKAPRICWHLGRHIVMQEFRCKWHVLLIATAAVNLASEQQRKKTTHVETCLTHARRDSAQPTETCIFVIHKEECVCSSSNNTVQRSSQVKTSCNTERLDNDSQTPPPFSDEAALSVVLTSAPPPQSQPVSRSSCEVTEMKLIEETAKLC